MIKGVYDTHGHDVVIKETKARRKPIAALLFASALGVVLLLYGVSHDGTDRIVALAVGILETLVVLPAAIYLIYRAFQDRPALVIGERGFTDHASITGVGYVAWDEVAGVRLDRIWVAIKLRDPGPVISRQPAWRRGMMRMNSKVVPGDIVIPTKALSVSPQELISLMIDRIPRQSER